MAGREQRVAQLERELRELRAVLQIDRGQHGPPAEDIQRAFGGRVFGVVGRPGELAGWGGYAAPSFHLSLAFTVQGERVVVDTSRHDPHEQPGLDEFHEQTALTRLAFHALTEARPALPFTLTFEEQAARLRVCGHEQDFKAYVCGDRAIASAPVGDLWVTVDLPTDFLGSQAIELHDEAEFRWGDEPVGAQ